MIERFDFPCLEAQVSKTRVLKFIPEDFSFLLIKELLKSRPELLSYDEIAEKRKTDLDVTDVCGIYFLFKKDELVYLGKTTNATQRIEQHRKSFKKEPWFHTLTFLPVPECDLDYFETGYFLNERPRFNGDTFTKSIIWEKYLSDFKFDKNDYPFTTSPLTVTAKQASYLKEFYNSFKTVY
jgi:hypothetical protein